MTILVLQLQFETRTKFVKWKKITGFILNIDTMFLLEKEARGSKKQNMHGAASLKKRQNSPQICMHSASTVRRKGFFCWHFPKMTLKGI